MKEVYDEDCVSSQVIFNLTSAIRYNASLLENGTVTNESMYGCPDEGWVCPGTNENATVYVTCGCPYTAWVQCALDQIGEGEQQQDEWVQQQKQVTFISCWDEQNLADHKTTNATLEAAASNCSQQIDIDVDFDAVKACNSDYSGKRAELLFAAANRFMGKWPEWSIMGGHFNVPHVLIGKNQSSMQEFPEPFYNSKDIVVYNEKLCSLDVNTGTCGQQIIFA